jgi:multidrug efflux pump subunit AcrB
MFATLPPLQQFGIITAMTIIYSFLASVFVLPTFLVFWAKWKKRKEGDIPSYMKKEQEEDISEESDDVQNKEDEGKGNLKEQPP